MGMGTEITAEYSLDDPVFVHYLCLTRRGLFGHGALEAGGP